MKKRSPDQNGNAPEPQDLQEYRPETEKMQLIYGPPEWFAPKKPDTQEETKFPEA
ncbi:MAG: hypothetical protein II916_09310 [Oscillospiraceae bacterium]|nr:hypothetical protein [Oscillospiraceae bacterium]